MRFLQSTIIVLLFSVFTLNAVDSKKSKDPNVCIGTLANVPKLETFLNFIYDQISNLIRASSSGISKTEHETANELLNSLSKAIKFDPNFTGYLSQNKMFQLFPDIKNNFNEIDYIYNRVERLRKYNFSSGQSLSHSKIYNSIQQLIRESNYLPPLLTLNEKLLMDENAKFKYDFIKHFGNRFLVSSSRCNETESAPRKLYSVYLSLITSEIKGFLTLASALKLRTSLEPGCKHPTDHWIDDLKEFKTKSIVRMKEYAMVFQNATSILETRIRRCDPPIWKRGENIVELVKDQKINFAPQTSGIDKNMIITGVKIVREKNILSIQIKQNRLSRGGFVKNGTLWKNISYGKMHEFSANEGLKLSSVSVPTGYLITGIQFVKDEDEDCKIIVRGTKYIFINGKLIVKKSDWFQNSDEPFGKIRRRSSNRKQIPQFLSDHWITDLRRLDHTSVNFYPSNSSANSSQTMIPVFDSRQVALSPPEGLDGVGLYVENTSNHHGGVIGLQIFVAPVPIIP